MPRRPATLKSKVGRRRGLRLGLGAFGVVLAGNCAVGQANPSTDLVAAEALFRRGRSDMLAGNYAVACPSLAESQRLDPRPGTLFTLAECERGAGRIATAAAHYEDFLAAVNRLTETQQRAQRDRVSIATEQLGALTEEVPTLTIVLPESAKTLVQVTRDGVPLGLAAMNVALPIDPGPHLITVQTGSGKIVQTSATVARGENRRVLLEVPEDAGEEAAPQQVLQGKSTELPPKIHTPIVATVHGPKATEPFRTLIPKGSSSIRPLTLGLAVAGGVAIVTGGVFLRVASSKVQAINRDNEQNHPYRESNGDFRTDQTIGAAFLSVGGAALAAAALLTWHHAARVGTQAMAVSLTPAISTQDAALIVKLKL